VPCPLFLPDQSFGDYYAGHCSAEPETVIATDKLRSCCNRGYARGTCAHAATAEADAAQYLIQSDRDGVIEVAWSLERNHHPVAVGVMAVLPGQTGATPRERQALALVAAYLNQKSPTG
jgi:hypothetical protein